MDMVVGPYCDHAKIFLRQTKTRDEPTENLPTKEAWRSESSTATTPAPH
jgi:hypothetical protein